MSGPAGTPCPTCGLYAYVNGCRPGVRCNTPVVIEAMKIRDYACPTCGAPAGELCQDPGTCQARRELPDPQGLQPAVPVEAPPPNAHPGKRGFCTHGVALNAPCVACHVENQREPDMARIYPNARNYTPSAEMGIAIAAAAEADAKAAAPDASVPFIASRGELGAPTQVDPSIPNALPHPEIGEPKK